jgi:hypothetical protein
MSMKTECSFFDADEKAVIEKALTFPQGTIAFVSFLFNKFIEILLILFD